MRSSHSHCQAQDLLQIALDAEPAPSVAPISVRGKLLPLRLQLNPVLLRQVLAFVAVPPSHWAAAQALEVRAQGLGHSLAATMKETRRGLQGRVPRTSTLIEVAASSMPVPPQSQSAVRT